MSRRGRGRITYTSSFTELPVPDLDALRRALKTVMRTAADFAKAVWYQRAQDLNIRRSGAYLQGIQQAQINPVSESITADNVTSVYEVVNQAPHARIIEDGHPAFSLAAAIDWSSRNGRIKRTSKGVPYLHIPFGHAAYASPAQRVQQGLTVATLRSMMPADVYRDAKKLASTTSLKAGPQFRTDSGGLQQFVQADRYKTGGRLGQVEGGPRFTAGAETTETWRSSRTVTGRTASGARLTNPAWQTGRTSGLFRTGPKGHSKYLTIRTITPHSDGWNIPAAPGYGVARQVAQVLNGGAGHARFQALLVKTIHDALTTARSP